MTPDAVIEEMKASGLRGRGAQDFSTGLKWSFVPKTTDKPHYLLCNADESEPGTFKDRVILEKLPHMMIEGMIIGSYAIQRSAPISTSAANYTYATTIIEKAIAEAYRAGFLGKIFWARALIMRCRASRSGRLYLRRRTGLISSLEGKKLPKLKPPFLRSKVICDVPRW